jgi:hypothetical protein
LRVLSAVRRGKVGCWARLMASEYRYNEFDTLPARSLNALLGPDDEYQY